MRSVDIKKIIILLALLLIVSVWFNFSTDVDAPTASGTLFTNIKSGGGLLDEVVQKATTDTYDISFAAYDRAFAEEMGLDEKYITDMDEGLRWLEIRMLTEGDQTNCYYNMILDKNVELDFPKKDNRKNDLTPVCPN